MTRTAFRITKAAYTAGMWTGAGARDNGGRWNSIGVAVVYTAENRSLAAMEQLIHLVKPRVLRGYVIASITFDETQERRVELKDLPADWAEPTAPPILKRYGDEWVAGAASVALAVPSAVIPGEWNFLFNPVHPEFQGLIKSAPAPFAYDHRLE